MMNKYTAIMLSGFMFLLAALILGIINVMFYEKHILALLLIGFPLYLLGQMHVFLRKLLGANQQ